MPQQFKIKSWREQLKQKKIWLKVHTNILLSSLMISEFSDKNKLCVKDNVLCYMETQNSAVRKQNYL